MLRTSICDETHSRIHGWFDAVIDFFFFVLNLVVAETFIQAREARAGVVGRASASVGLLAIGSACDSGDVFLHDLCVGSAIVRRFTAS